MATTKVRHVTNLSGVPEFARKSILDQIARDAGIAVSDIEVEE